MSGRPARAESRPSPVGSWLGVAASTVVNADVVMCRSDQIGKTGVKTGDASQVRAVVADAARVCVTPDARERRCTGIEIAGLMLDRSSSDEKGTT